MLPNKSQENNHGNNQGKNQGILEKAQRFY